jgi:hypothetical protein
MAQPANMSDIHIRPGVEDDIPVILALIHGLAESVAPAILSPVFSPVRETPPAA